jgi:hypothetical protein
MLLTTLLSKALSLGSVTKKVYFFYPSCEDANKPSDSKKVHFTITSTAVISSVGL